MKKVIDLAEIAAREQELVDELGRLRAIKKYAIKYGADFGTQSELPSTPGEGGESVPPPRPINIPRKAPSNASASPDLMKALRDTIVALGNHEFSYPNIEAMFAGQGLDFSRSAIFEGIAALKNNGEILKVQEGAGRRPAIYHVTDGFNPSKSKEVECGE